MRFSPHTRKFSLAIALMAAVTLAATTSLFAKDAAKKHAAKEHAAKKQTAKKAEAKKPAEKKAWALICNKNKKNCRLYAHIKTDQNVVASSLSLMNLKVKGMNSEQTVAIIMLPLGLHIPSGVTVQIDKSLNFKANLIECKSAGCRAIFNVKHNVLAHMLTGKKINVVIVDSQSRKQLRLAYSLKDFDKTYKAFAALN